MLRIVPYLLFFLSGLFWVLINRYIVLTLRI